MFDLFLIDNLETAELFQANYYMNETIQDLANQSPQIILQNQTGNENDNGNYTLVTLIFFFNDSPQSLKRKFSIFLANYLEKPNREIWYLELMFFIVERQYGSVFSFSF